MHEYEYLSRVRAHMLLGQFNHRHGIGIGIGGYGDWTWNWDETGGDTERRLRLLGGSLETATD